MRFAQVALSSAYSEQLARLQDQSRSSRSVPRSQTHPYLPRSAPVNTGQQNGVMKPRMHLYEAIVPSSDGSREQGAQRPQRTMVATLELPGLARSDITVTARPNGELVIAGERRESRLAALALEGDIETNNRSRRRGRTIFNELRFGRFQRILKLTPGTDVSIVSFRISLIEASEGY